MTTLAPTTAPVIDLTSPKSAAASFFRAVDAGDTSGMLKTIAPAESTRQELVTAYVELISATHRLATAMDARFGLKAGDAGAELKLLERATFRIDGDVATAELTGRDRPVVLRRVDNQWRVDLPASKGESSPTGEQATFVLNLASALGEAADEVGDGRFATVFDAQAALQGKVHSALMTVRRSPKPATRPATSPAST